MIKVIQYLLLTATVGAAVLWVGFVLSGYGSASRAPQWETQAQASHRDVVSRSATDGHLVSQARFGKKTGEVSAVDGVSPSNGQTVSPGRRSHPVTSLLPKGHGHQPGASTSAAVGPPLQRGGADEVINPATEVGEVTLTSNGAVITSNRIQSVGGGGGSSVALAPASEIPVGAPVAVDAPQADHPVWTVATNVPAVPRPDLATELAHVPDAIARVLPKVMSAQEISERLDAAIVRALYVEPAAGNVDQTQRLQSALNLGGTIVLRQGVYQTGPLTLSRSSTVLLAEPGAILELIDMPHPTHLLRVDANRCLLVGLVIDGSGRSVRPIRNRGVRRDGLYIAGDRNYVYQCEVRNVGRLDAQPIHGQAGIAVWGDGNVIQECRTRTTRYAGILNVGDYNVFRDCDVRDHHHKGWSQANKGKPVEAVVVNGLTGDSPHDASFLLQLDSGSRPVLWARLVRITAGPFAANKSTIVKLATAEKVFIEHMNLPEQPGCSINALVLAEGLGQVVVRDSVIAGGITHYPDRSRYWPLVDHLVIESSRIGNGAEHHPHAHSHDRVLAGRMEYRDCVFDGVVKAAFVPETPSTEIDYWIIENCRFITYAESGKVVEVMMPRGTDNQPYQSLRESGKLVFRNNTVETPNAARFPLSSESWFAPLLQTTDDRALFYRGQGPPTGDGIHWRAGTVIQSVVSPAAWLCVKDGAPGEWVVMSYD